MALLFSVTWIPAQQLLVEGPGSETGPSGLGMQFFEAGLNLGPTESIIIATFGILIVIFGQAVSKRTFAIVSLGFLGIWFVTVATVLKTAQEPLYFKAFATSAMPIDAGGVFAGFIGLALLAAVFLIVFAPAMDRY